MSSEKHVRHDGYGTQLYAPQLLHFGTRNSRTLSPSQKGSFSAVTLGSGLRYTIEGSLSVRAHDHDTGDVVHPEALREGNADLGVGHLARTALAAQLADDLDRGQTARLAAVAVGEQAAVGVDREGTAESGVALLHEGSR